MIARRVACRPVERDLPAASLEVRAPVQQSDQLVGPSIGRREVAVPPEDSVPVAGTPATLVVAFRSLAHPNVGVGDRESDEHRAGERTEERFEDQPHRYDLDTDTIVQYTVHGDDRHR